MAAELLSKAVVLGLVEGVTEFIPVSSTGHLIVVGEWLGQTDDAAKTFDIFIQLGAILAIVWLYRVRLLQAARGLGEDRPGQPPVLPQPARSPSCRPPSSASWSTTGSRSTSSRPRSWRGR